MRVFDSLEALAGIDLGPPDTLESRSVVSVGVFDGVHLGHQRLLHELVEMASELGGVPTVVTFSNHPDAVLHGEAPPALVSVPHRLRLLRRAGVERVLMLAFDDGVRDMTPEYFSEQVLVKGLRACGLLLGYDSAMGKDRAGTPACFAELGVEHGFTVREAQPFTVDGQPVSSTLIREAIAGGDLDKAHRLLGRWPSSFGEVVRGEGRGRDIGFPTANVVPQTPVLPPNGVYAAQVLLAGETWPAVANLGHRPTFTDDDTPTLEVHLLDFEGDLYGQTLEICFLAHLRDEQRFSDVDALATQIHADIGHARALLAT